MSADAVVQRVLFAVVQRPRLYQIQRTCDGVAPGGPVFGKEDQPYHPVLERLTLTPQYRVMFIDAHPSVGSTMLIAEQLGVGTHQLGEPGGLGLGLRPFFLVSVLDDLVSRTVLPWRVAGDADGNFLHLGFV